MECVASIENPRSFASSSYRSTSRTQNAYSEQVKSFWRNTSRFAPSAVIGEELEADKFYIIVSGWIVEIAEIKGKRRQVISFQLPGDLIRRSSETCNRVIVALTNVEIGDADLLRDKGDTHWKHRIALAESRAEEQLFNHLLRMGRLTAEERLLHLLLEFHDRLENAGLIKGATFRLPVTQQMLGDALGLSLVHINRTLQELRRRNLLTLRRGLVTLHDRSRLAALACYEPCRPERSSQPSTLGRVEALSPAIGLGTCAQAIA
jgi:CRP-like cAMP-binding protein